MVMFRSHPTTVRVALVGPNGSDGSDLSDRSEDRSDLSDRLRSSSVGLYVLIILRVYLFEDY